MIRKSAWLLSAGMFAVATPAFAQTAVSTTDTDKQAAQPTPGATEGAATQAQPSEQQPVTTGDIVITATRRNQALSDVPMAVSAVTGAAASIYWRDRHPAAEPGFALAPRLLDDLGSGRRRRPHPRHRHGRRQSRPRRLGRRVHRRRLSRPRGNGLDGPRAARPNRGAARPAGHFVRTQHVGGPDFDHHRQAALHSGSERPDRCRQLRLSPRRGERHRTAQRHDRRPSRRCLGEARRLSART